MPGPTTADLALRRRAIGISLAVGVAMLGLKLGAYIATGSNAVLSDALESVVHVGAVFFAWWSVRWSSSTGSAGCLHGRSWSPTLAPVRARWTRRRSARVGFD